MWPSFPYHLLQEALLDIPAGLLLKFWVSPLKSGPDYLDLCALWGQEPRTWQGPGPETLEQTDTRSLMQEEEEKPAWAALPRLPASSGPDGGRLSTCWALTFPCAGWSGCRWMLGPRKPRLTAGDPAGAPINDEVQRAGRGGRRRGRPAVPAHP